MHRLHDDTEDELDPEIPSPVEILLYGATADPTKHTTNAGPVPISMPFLSDLIQLVSLTKMMPREPHTVALRDRTCQPPYPLLTISFLSLSHNYINTFKHNKIAHLQVTLPPAVEKPPNTLEASTIFQLVPAPASGCHALIKNKLSCMMGQRPNSSDHGAHSSQPKA